MPNPHDPSTLEPGSPVHRVLLAICAAKGEDDQFITRRQVGIMLGLTQHQVDMLLEPGVHARLLTKANSSDHGPIYRLGPAAQALGELPPFPEPRTPPQVTPEPAPAATPQAAPVADVAGHRAHADGPRVEGKARRSGRGNGQRLPPLDLSAVRVEQAPVPPGKLGEGETRYDQLFGLLIKPGDCVRQLPHDYMATLRHAAQKYAARHLRGTGHALVVRRVDERTCGVWRLTTAEAGAEAAPRRSPAKRAA